MNILKKTVACLAAATVMTSLAVTASAEYLIEGKEFDDHYALQISGIPQTVFDLDTATIVMLTFDNGGDVSTQKAITFFYGVTNDNGDENAGMIHDISGEKYADLTASALELDNGEKGYTIKFDKNNEYLADFMKCSEGGLSLSIMARVNGSETPQRVYFNSHGDTRAEAYLEPVTFTWQALNSASEPASEPTSSEPASEPVSEPTSSEPVSEPAASEPVSSETTASQPSNVDTGTAGVAAIVGTAVLAAGAVIMTRKKK